MIKQYDAFMDIVSELKYACGTEYDVSAIWRVFSVVSEEIQNAKTSSILN